MVVGPITVVSILSAVAAFVLGKYLWSWYTQPILLFIECSTKSVPGGSIVPEGESVRIIYRVHVKNDGSNAAQNCKAEMSFSGSNNVQTHQIDTVTCWSERENPPRVTINAGETTSFDLFVQFRKDATNFIRFPSELGWPDYSTLNLPKQSMNRIPTTDLSDVEWDTNKVRVTAENAVLAEGRVTLDWDIGGSIEEVKLQVKQTQGAFRRYLRVL